MTGTIVIGLGFDAEDVEAYKRELQAIWEEFGFPDDIQPHRRVAYDAAMKRASETFQACLVVKTDDP